MTFVTTGLFYTVCSMSAVQYCQTSPTCLGPGSRLPEHHRQAGAGHRHRDPLARGSAAPEEAEVWRPLVFNGHDSAEALKINLDIL